eukprot:snap_masked-scaffold_1-processed-gene-15.32-mRNA-1 protein AED:1.00 eAED:1.00 QI:0/0/0/0/1/1/2/0/368
MFGKRRTKGSSGFSSPETSPLIRRTRLKSNNKSTDSGSFGTDGVWRDYDGTLYNSATRHVYDESPCPSFYVKSSGKSSLEDNSVPNAWLKAHLLSRRKMRREYYYNPYLQETSWFKPKTTEDEKHLNTLFDVAGVKKRKCVCCESDEFYPCFDRTSENFYWYNQKRGKRTWRKPKNKDNEIVTQFTPVKKYLKEKNQRFQNEVLVKKVIQFQKATSDLEQRVESLKRKVQNLTRIYKTNHTLAFRMSKKRIGKSSKEKSKRTLRNTLRNLYEQDELLQPFESLSNTNTLTSSYNLEENLEQNNMGFKSIDEMKQIVRRNLRSLDVFADISDEDLALIRKNSKIQSFKKGQVLIAPNEIISYLYLVSYK